MHDPREGTWTRWQLLKMPAGRKLDFCRNACAQWLVKPDGTLLVPERGGELGNFGAAAIDARESWVTVPEGVWSDDARRRGARGATRVARVLWSKPNPLAPFP